MARKKTSALTEAELFFIQEKSKTQSAEEIAASLNRDIADIAEHIPDQPKEKEESHMHRLMGRTTRDTKRGGIAVMTKEASELADTTRQARRDQKLADCVYKPLGD